MSAAKGPPPANPVEAPDAVLPYGATSSESFPGLGRAGTYIEVSRQASGGLPDDPGESNPVINKQPFKITR